MEATGGGGAFTALSIQLARHNNRNDEILWKRLVIMNYWRENLSLQESRSEKTESKAMSTGSSFDKLGVGGARTGRRVYEKAFNYFRVF